MGSDRIIELVIKKKLGKITLAEQRELDSLIAEKNPEKHSYSIAKDLLESPLNFDKNLYANDAAAVLNKVHQATRKEKTGKVIASGYFRASRFKIAAVAASFLAISLLLIHLYNSNKLLIGKHGSKNLVTTSTNKGSKSNIILPDGTKVWINSETKLTYSKSFGEDSREVNLDGEAYFDVFKDAKLPFIVRTKTIDIKVLGTAFNIRAYDNEGNTQTTLLRGSVEVLLKKKNNTKITLKPNEKIIVQNDPAQSQATKDPSGSKIPEIALIQIDPPNIIDSAIAETRWIKNSFSFDQQKLSDLIPVLEERYGVSFVIKNKASLNRRFSAKIENDSLKDILESFRLSTGLEYKIDKNVVTIYN